LRVSFEAEASKQDHKHLRVFLQHPNNLTTLNDAQRYNNTTMVKEISYTTINHVIESWESLKRTKNYQEVAGSKLFQRLFDKCPQSKM
jgi:hypothetical protein